MDPRIPIKRRTRSATIRPETTNHGRAASAEPQVLGTDTFGRNFNRTSSGPAVPQRLGNDMYGWNLNRNSNGPASAYGPDCLNARPTGVNARPTGPLQYEGLQNIGAQERSPRRFNLNTTDNRYRANYMSKNPRKNITPLMAISSPNFPKQNQNVAGISSGAGQRKVKPNTEDEKRNQTSSRNGNRRNYGESGDKRQARNRHKTGERHDNNKRHFMFGFKKLEEMGTEAPDDVLVILANERNGFTDLLDEKLSNDYLILIMRVIAKMCQSAFNSNKSKIIFQICRENFIDQLKTFVLLLPIQDDHERKRSSYYWKNVDEFWTNMTIYIETVIKVMPTVACDLLPQLIKAILYTLLQLKLSDDIKHHFEELELKLKMRKEEMKFKKEVKDKTECEYEEPPDDFRTISLYPSSLEVTSHNRAYVRPNITDGSYRDVNHYLDVQFRLLREDFVAPLRKGICEYLDNKGHFKKLSNIKVHPKVVFLRPQIVNGSFGVLLQFEFDVKKKKINYEHSRRFMYGSLVCFTKDNFQTLIFGKILDRSAELLQIGQLVIGFEAGITIDDYTSDFVMVECKVYFEPYYHVLNALQEMDEENFPMTECFVYVSSNIELPTYLQDNKILIAKLEFNVILQWPDAQKFGLTDKEYKTLKESLKDEENLLLLMQNYPVVTFHHYVQLNKNKIYGPMEIEISGESENYIVAVTTHWSSQLGLNDSQYAAFQSALTEKFAIIQGPPGTGKTYLGLRIAETLLLNTDIWHNNSTPMLVVCYTNHALDQFLEGLSKVTKEIVRIGGQSKNKKLAQFNIKEIRFQDHHKDAKQLLRQKRSEVETCVASLTSLYEFLDATCMYDGIINLCNYLYHNITLRGSRFQSFTRECLKTWLLGGRSYEERRMETMSQALSEIDLKLEEEDNLALDINEEYDGLNRLENLFDLDDFSRSLKVDIQIKYALSLSKMRTEITEKVEKLQVLKNDIQSGINDQSIYKNVWKLERDIFQLKNDLEYLEFRMEEGRNTQIRHMPDNVDLQSPQNMQPDDRWRFYFYCLRGFQKHLRNKLNQEEVNYHKIYQEYEEVRNIEDAKIMRSKLVVGMTTTSAARLQQTLQALKCPIVIVEEAAEILESHIITSLTNHCQHLILIGDHQQLRPSTADYKMEKDYKLGISLFERMLSNNIHCNILNVQHRMRPEIAKLIVPAIYPALENHDSVKRFPPVNGVDPCLYFIDHSNPEQMDLDNSKTNYHEVSFFLQLARYLLLNGYKPDDITIVAAYSAQMFLFWRERKKYDLLHDVRITVLDNYQGEESKIILLSLVRNNSDNSIGFLALENRVCVALSRAREGFYIMGNIDLLCANSKVWPKVRERLEEQNAVGKALSLRCQIHIETVTEVKNANDFSKVPEGGCDRLCGFILTCGHPCTMQCHSHNRLHDAYKCYEKCTKVLCENDHICPDKCFETCKPCLVLLSKKLSCGHTSDIQCYIKPENYKCQVLVQTELPCKHIVDKPCYADPEIFPCTHKCDTRLEKCGHSCMQKCHIRDDPDHLWYKCMKECANSPVGCTMKNKHKCPRTCFEDCIECTIVVKKKRTVCNHVYDIECRADVDQLTCKKPCKKILPCGHHCKLKCSEACGNCDVQVEKTATDCGHQVRVQCSREPTSRDCYGKCPKTLKCGHPCQSRCKDVCTNECKFLVNNPFRAECGHVFKVPCFIGNAVLMPTTKTLLKYCQKPCNITLDCGHQCAGSCSECYQGRIHKTCSEDCGVPLVCGHKCTVPCRQTCQPCKEPCTYKCKHSKCKKKCGEPCTPCTEPCLRRCKHVKCTAKCGLKCNVAPCKEHCEKILKCGHQCIGFCGDPCPPLCLICNKEELLEEFILGYEDEEGARFVLLEECNHVIESVGLENWLASSDDQINVKRCPRCNTPLSFTKRYSDYIKESISNVTQVKRMYYGNYKENEKARLELLTGLKGVYENSKLKEHCSQLLKVYSKLSQPLQPVKKDRRQPMNNVLAKTLMSKIQIFEQICKLYDDSKLTERNEKCLDYITFLFNILIKQADRITNQEISDFSCEIKRLRRMLQLAKIENHVKSRLTDSKVSELYTSVTKEIYSFYKYEVEKDASIKDDLSELAKLTSNGLAVSDQELKQIVKVIGVRSGAWYMCPNGHPYAIGECGGAMQLGKCAECKAPIGGQGHRLVSGNAHSNIDSSTYAAWSEAANMMNYDI